MSESDTPISKKEMLECLERSGYCFESRLVRTLTGAGLFVESSQPLYDERSGKTREVDFVVERGFLHQPLEAGKVCVKTVFVIEAINNRYPVVLMTRKSWTPNTEYDNYLPYHITPSEFTDPHPFLKEEQYELFGVQDWALFSQYCTFTRKKHDEQLMAMHSEDLYSSVQKAVDYAFHLREVASQWMLDAGSEYWRIFNWQPVVVLQNDLYTMEENVDGANQLEAVKYAHLEFNFHHKGEPKSVVVTFVTEAAFLDFINEALKRDSVVENRLMKERLKFDLKK